jgi:hypothetical protein
MSALPPKDAVLRAIDSLFAIGTLEEWARRELIALGIIHPDAGLLARQDQAAPRLPQSPTGGTDARAR